MATETTKTSSQTTIDTLTVKQVQALRTEAAAAGDSDMVVWCDRAISARGSLSGDEAALAKCVEAISDAEAMQ